MATKAAYDQSVGETLCAHLDDPTTIPQVPPYPDQLSKPWEPEESPYDEEDDDDDEE